MALSNAFYEALKSQNVRRIRIMMEDSLLLDTSFKLFAEMAEAADSVPGLYDEHDGTPFTMNKASWNDDYMNQLMVQAIQNFSKERIAHLKEVVQYLRPVPKTISDYQIGKQKAKEDGSYLGSTVTKGAAIGAVVGAVAGGAIAAVTEAPALGAVVGGATIAAATGGAVAYFANKGDK